MRKVPIISSAPFELFLDLDGVFADFDKRVIHLSGGRHPREIKQGMWKMIMADRDFFISLEMMPDAMTLWDYVKQYKPKFLTGAPPGNRAQSQKREWVVKHFGPEHQTIVLPSKEKQNYSGHYKVLVDDMSKNIDAWISKGGAGILHRDVWDTIDQLEELRAQYS